MIHTKYDPEADVLHVRFGPDDATYDSSEEVAPGVYVEFDTASHPIGVEITSVRWRSEARPDGEPARDTPATPVAAA